jgi:hypothetical protein
MLEKSATRVKEDLPNDVKTIPRGCTTGCLTLPFRTLHSFRYVIVLLLISTLPGHVPSHTIAQTPFIPFVSIKKKGQLPSGSIASVLSETHQHTSSNASSSFSEFVLNPSMKSLVKEATQVAGNFNEAWKAKGLPMIPLSLQSCVAIEGELTEDEKKDLQKSLGDVADKVRVYDVSVRAGVAKRVYVMPDGSVMLSQIASR